MDESHSINAFAMILGVILGGSLAFAGSWVEHHFVRARTAIGFILGACICILAAADWVAFSETVANGKGLSAIGKLITENRNAGMVAVWISVPAAAGVFGTWLYGKQSRYASLSASAILFGTLSSIPFVQGWISASLVYTVIAIVVVTVILILLRLKYYERFTIFGTAIAGGLLISWLFSRFYYLPVWMFVLLAVVFCGSGLAMQLASLSGKNQTRRAPDGKGQAPT